MQKEIERLKRNFKHDNEALLISGIGMYYINTAEPGQVQGTWRKYCEKQDMNRGKSGSDLYWDLLEEDNFISIAKKSLSGKIDEALKVYGNISIQLKKELGHIIKEPTNPFILQSMVEYIAERLNYTGEYAIMTIAGELSKRSSDTSGYATSDDDLCDVGSPYRFLLVSICPLEPVSLGLYYDREKKSITHWPGNEHILKNPIGSFLYPAPCGGEEDWSHVVIYIKPSKTPLTSLAKDVFECEPTLSGTEKVNALRDVIKSVISKEDKGDIILQVFDTLAQEEKLEGEIFLTSKKVQKVLEEVIQDTIPEDFENIYEEKFGTSPAPIQANTITKEIEKIKTSVQVNILKETDHIKFQDENGETLLVIKLDDTVQIVGKEYLL